MCCSPRSSCLLPPLLHCSCVLELSVIALGLSRFYIHLPFPVFCCKYLGCAQPLSVFTLGYTKPPKISFLQTRTSYFFGFVPPFFPQANPVFSSKEYILVKLKPFGISLVYQEQTRLLPSVSQTKETERGITLRNKKKINPDSSASSQAAMNSDVLWQLPAEGVNVWSVLKFPGLIGIYSLN